ncbi:MAG: O-antigen ligase family protein [Bacteroidia bacterium]|nr:O-antigen ligase family protein [Bacteroidia bacterium]
MEVLKANRSFIFTLIIWSLSGIYGHYLAFAVVPLTLLAFKSRNMYMEMFLGFIFILILSDSLLDSLSWAGQVKYEYIVLLYLLMILSRKSFGKLNLFYQRFIPFFIVAFICLFNSPADNVILSFEKTLSYLFLLLIVPNYMMRCHRDYGTEFYRTLVYLCVGMVIYGIIAKYVHPSQAYRENRFCGIFGNPNGLGVFLTLLVLLISVISDIYPGIFSRREKIVFYISIILSLVWSDSRNSLFAILIFIFFSYFHKLSTFLGFIIFIVFLFSYPLVIANLPAILNSLGLGSYLRVNTLEDASGRFVAWYFAIDHIKQSIFIGKGFDYTNYLFMSPANVKYLSALGHQGNAHNSYLTLWLDTGLIGLLTYLWALISTFFKVAKRSNLAFPVMYAVLFSTFFESWLTASLNPFTILLFVILSMLTNEEIFAPKAQAALLVQ